MVCFVALLFLQILSFPSDLVILMCVGLALLLHRILLSSPSLALSCTSYYTLVLAILVIIHWKSWECGYSQILDLFCVLTGNRNIE